MTDTFAMKWTVGRISESRLANLGAKFIRRDQFTTWALNPKNDRSKPNITFIFPRDGSMHIKASASLPTLLYGHNSILPTEDEIKQLLPWICNEVSEMTGLRLSLGDATAAVVDFARDVTVDEGTVLEVIRRIASRSLSRMTSHFYNNETVYFKDAGSFRTIRIYSKHLEMLSRDFYSEDQLAKARNLLRIEHRFSGRRSFQRLSKKIGRNALCPTVLLTQDVADLVLDKVSDNLRLQDAMAVQEQSTLSILRKSYPLNIALVLAGFIELMKEEGRNCYRDKELGLSRHAYYRRMRQLKNVGLL